MKVAVISTPVFPIPCSGYAGLEVVAYHCAKGLAAKGHAVTVIAPSGSQVPGCQVVECGPAGHWNEEAFYGGWKREEGGKLFHWPGYWSELLKQDVVIDHSVAGDEHLLVRIDGRSRWLTFQELYAWAESCSPALLDGDSVELPVTGLEVPAATGIHTIEWRKVSAVIRHRRKDKLLSVQTMGSSIPVVLTAGHSLMVAGEGRLKAVRADEAKWMCAATSRRIPPGNEERHWPLSQDDVTEACFGPKRKRVEWPIPLTDNDLLLFGLWVGDGCYDRASVRLSSGQVTRHVAASVAKEFGANCKDVTYCPDVAHQINSVVLKVLMQKVGFSGFSDTKRIPDWVFGLSARQIGLFLRGYFSADGCVSDRVSVESVNLTLIRQTVVLLALCGIRCNVSVSAQEKNPLTDNPIWSLDIPNDEYANFVENVGFIQEYKQSKAATKVLRRESWRGDVPFCLVRERKPRSDSKRTREKLLSITRLIRENRGEQAAQFKQSAMAWRRVDEVKETGRSDEFVYDLAVPGPENFFVGTVCCHNSWNKFSYMLKAEGRIKCPILGVMHAPVRTMYGSLPPVPKPCIVCISEDQARQFREIHEENDCRVCHNGLDLDQYKPLNIARSKRFLFLARFSTIKGPLLALQACKEAGAELDLIGDTSITQEPELFNQCQKMADGKQLRIVGPCSRGNAVWWFSQAHCFLHPNKLFREPFGLAPVESMACGTPVIAWKRGACQETILEGETGWLVKSEAELVAAVRRAREGIPEGMRRRCVEWAARFSLQNMVDRYEQLATEAIDSGGW